MDEGCRQLIERFTNTRTFSEKLASLLPEGSMRIQSMPDVSPTWWHLAHTSWFFAKNFLGPIGSSKERDELFHEVLNSYYRCFGKLFHRPSRGLVTWPLDRDVADYRTCVTERVVEATTTRGLTQQQALILEVGIAHEQQHQELVLSDIKHVLSMTPKSLRQPIVESVRQNPQVDLEWIDIIAEPGLYEVGAKANEGFVYDNEMPVHQYYQNSSFALHNRPISWSEYDEFIADKGYERSEFWHDNAFTWIESQGLKAPLYWQEDGDVWTLAGDASRSGPVSHISFYEASAFAEWYGQQYPDEHIRLPTEQEWEIAAKRFPESKADFADSMSFQPRFATDSEVSGLFGGLWEWTQSPYQGYPGFSPFGDELREYNGKFMDGQYVLRGGSVATPEEHIRATYRNFWPPQTQFQFAGLRLAREYRA